MQSTCQLLVVKKEKEFEKGALMAILLDSDMFTLFANGMRKTKLPHKQAELAAWLIVEHRQISARDNDPLVHLRYISVITTMEKLPCFTSPVHEDYYSDPDGHSFCDPDIDEKCQIHVGNLLSITLNLLGLKHTMAPLNDDYLIMRYLSPAKDNGWHPSVHLWSSPKQHEEVKLTMLVGKRIGFPRDISKMICSYACTPTTKKRKRD